MKINYEELLGSEARSLLEHKAKVSKERIYRPNPNWVSEIVAQTDRPVSVMRSLQQIIGTGRLANTGYVTIFPVDQGVEHSAGSAFGPNPEFFDPENIVKFACETGCNAVASTLGVLGM